MTYFLFHSLSSYGAYIGIAVFDNPLAEMKKLISWMMFKEAEDYEVAIQRFRRFVDEVRENIATWNHTIACEFDHIEQYCKNRDISFILHLLFTSTPLKVIFEILYFQPV